MMGSDNYYRVDRDPHSHSTNMAGFLEQMLSSYAEFEEDFKLFKDEHFVVLRKKTSETVEKANEKAKARHFNEKQIDVFKECFYFHARKGDITNEVDLSIIMRSLGSNVTKDEVKKYFDKAMKSSDGKIDFASFVEIMHDHSRVENNQQELKSALIAQDREKRGYVSAASLRHILTNIGEKLSDKEVDALLREAGVAGNGQVNIQNFVDTVMTPSPDY